MKFYQFLLLFTFCSVVINAYSINGDIPFLEKLRVNERERKDDLCINIPMKRDVYVTNCRYRHDRQKVYCDIKGNKKLYVMIPIIDHLGKITKNDVTVTRWQVYKRVNIPRDPFGGNVRDYNWLEVNEIMETGSFESIEEGDNYHGHYFFDLEGNGININLYYDKIVINKY